MKSAEDYSQLSKAIGIHILNFTSIFNVKKYHNVFHITEKDSGLIYFKDLELHTLELKKFAKDRGSEQEDQEILSKIKSSLDLWMAFLTRHDLLRSHLPSSSEGTAIQKALGVLETMNFKDEEREAYEARLKWWRIETNTLKKYEADGFEKGKEEERKKLAFSMMQEGVSLDIVSRITSFSIDHLKSLTSSSTTI